MKLGKYILVTFLCLLLLLGPSHSSETPAAGNHAGDHRGLPTATSMATSWTPTVATSRDGGGVSLAWDGTASSRLLLALQRHNPRSPMKCDRFPRICHANGSPGPDCCRKRCVNVMRDRVNCGWCGNRCGHGEACCSGTCVNITFDRRNCGGCRKRCKRGSYCGYGMCSYA